MLLLPADEPLTEATIVATLTGETFGTCAARSIVRSSSRPPNPLSQLVARRDSAARYQPLRTTDYTARQSMPRRRTE